MVNDPAWVASVRSLYQKFIREWISNALSYAPCTSQGLLQVCLETLICLIHEMLNKFKFNVFENAKLKGSHQCQIEVWNNGTT